MPSDTLSLTSILNTHPPLLPLPPQVLRTVTDRGLLAFVLRRLRASVPLMLGMNKVQSKLLKQAVELFRDGERKARIQAFLLVR